MRMLFLLVLICAFAFPYNSVESLEYAAKPCEPRHEGKLCLNINLFKIISPAIEFGRTTFDDLKKNYGGAELYITKKNRYRRICYIFSDADKYILVEFGSWDISGKYRIHNIHLSKLNTVDNICKCNKLKIVFNFNTKAGLKLGITKQKFFRVTKLSRSQFNDSGVSFYGGMLDKENNIFINQSLEAKFQDGLLVDLFLEEKEEPFE